MIQQAHRQAGLTQATTVPREPGDYANQPWVPESQGIILTSLGAGQFGQPMSASSADLG